MVRQVAGNLQQVNSIQKQINYQIELVLCEAKTGFDMHKFKTLETEKEMFEYAKKHLKQLGRGSGRVVFMLNNRHALKISTDEIFGRDQNEAEVNVATYPNAKPIVAKIYDFDPKYRWLVSEVVRQLTSEAEFEKEIGMSPKNLAHLLKDIPAAQRFYPEIIESPIVRAIIELVEIGVWELELSRVEHWGKTADGRIVVLDSGV